MRRLAPLAVLILPSAAAAQQGWGMADSVYGREAMRASRAALVREHGGMPSGLFLADRLEYQTDRGDGAVLADLEGWWGTDERRLRLKAETKYGLAADAFEEARLEALYARPVSAFWDAQAGVRVDAAGPGARNWAVLGVEGIAPWFVHVDASLYVSGHGEVESRIEGTTDLLLTQRLVLQPRAEILLAAEDRTDAGVGAGLSKAETGLRLRYEIRRTFAPYVGLSYERRVGRAADLARLAGDEPGAVSFVAGVRFRY